MTKENNNSDVWKYNQLLFLFFFITQNICMSWESNEKNVHIQGYGVVFQWNLSVSVYCP